MTDAPPAANPDWASVPSAKAPTGSSVITMHRHRNSAKSLFFISVNKPPQIKYHINKYALPPQAADGGLRRTPPGHGQLYTAFTPGT